MTRRLRQVLVLAALAACGPDAPERVFVPGPSFALTVSASTGQGDSAVVGIGEPLVLHARRTSGPWVEGDRRAVAGGGCWWVRPPAPTEPEVADNLRWVVDPPGSAELNTDFRADRTREVRFGGAGSYTLIASDQGRCGDVEAADTVRVRVVGPGAAGPITGGPIAAAPGAAGPVGGGPIAAAPGAAAPVGGPDCIRGGSTREEVRAVMGEPDSVVFGAWIYGRSSVSFGYGTVVQLSNEDGRLILC